MNQNPDMQSSGQEREEKRPLVFRLYDWYDKYDTWRERIDWLMALMKANAATSTAVVTTTTAAVTVGTVAVVAPETFDRWIGREQPPAIVENAPAPPAPVVAEAPPPAPEPVRVETANWGKATVYPIEGRDAAGRRALFEVGVLPKEFSWQRKDSEHLSRAGELLPPDRTVLEVLVGEFREGLNRSGAVMAVGVASQEGDVREEAERARRRAATAAAWLMQALPETTAIYTLNLGQYKSSCAVGETEDTAWQRPVLMIGIREQESGVDLAQALGNAMEGKSNLPSRDCYSNFDLSRYR